jgi:hypothetical protein
MSTAESTWDRSAGTARLRRLFALQPGEAPRLACLLLMSLFLGIFTAFYLSTALALFLDSFPATVLPFAYIASSLVGFLGVTLFTRLARRVPPARLVIFLLSTLTAAAAGFWGLSLAVPQRGIAFAMAVGIAPAVTLLDLGFWTLAGRLFDLRQGKRLAGLISAGEVVASILGFFLIPVLLPLLGRPIHLLPIAATGLALCTAVVAFTGRRYRGLLAAEVLADQETPQRTRREAPRKTSRYFVLIALSMTLFIAAFYLIDFAFLSEVPAFFREGSGQVAQFLGLFFGAAKICELLVKTFLSGRLLSQFGLRAGLLALPAALLGCALLAVGAGAAAGSRSIAFFVLVALAKLVWTMLARSVFDPAYRMLYQPLSPDRRLAFQAGLEGRVRQLAVFLVGTVLALAAGRGAGAFPILASLLPALGVWIFVVALLYREYRSRLLRTLNSHLSESDARVATSPQQEPVIRREIEELFERIAWDTAALVDLRFDPNIEPAAAATRRSLALDLAAEHRALFALLAQLYDPQVIEQVQSSLADAGGGAAVYALEILDVLMSPDLKALVLPLLEVQHAGTDPAAGLARLEAVAPQQRLSPLDRLGALLHREPGSVGLKTKASALAALGALAGGEVRADLVANLFHPERLLQEEAALAIHAIDPAAYALHARKLPAADRERLDLVVGGGSSLLASAGAR